MSRSPLEDFEGQLRSRQESIFKGLRSRADDYETRFPTPESVRLQLPSAADVYLFDEAVAAAQDGEMSRAIGVASDASSPTTVGQMRKALDVILFKKVVTAALNSQFQQVNELMQHASGPEGQKWMQLGLDACYFRLTVEAARDGNFDKAFELAGEGSTADVRRLYRLGIDADVFAFSIAAARDGKFGYAVNLTRHASDEYRESMRKGLDVVVEEKTEKAAESSDFKQAIELIEYGSSRDVQRRMRAELDSMVLNAVVVASQAGNLEHAQSLVPYIYAKDTWAGMLEFCGVAPDVNAKGAPPQRFVPSARDPYTEPLRTADIDAARAKFGALIGAASPPHRTLFAAYSQDVILAINGLVEDVEIQDEASGKRTSPDVLTRETVRILGEKGYETDRQSVTRLVYAVESVRADLGQQSRNDFGLGL